MIDGLDTERIKIREIVSGLGFLEGPMEIPGGDVLVTDIGSGAIHRISPATGVVSDFAHVPGSPSALAAGPDGSIYVPAGPGLALAKSDDGGNIPAPAGTVAKNAATAGIYKIAATGEVSLFVSEVNGNALVSPNDLVFDNTGGFYFTDHGHAEGRVAALGGLYYVDASGETRELIHDARVSYPLTSPNGVGLSPDGSRLYVAETASGRLWEWEVTGPGELAAPPGAEPGVGARLVSGQRGFYLLDSLAVDERGLVIIGTLRRGCLTVLDPATGNEEIIEFPTFDSRITNACFGGPDNSTLYVTAAGRGALWELTWPWPGARLSYSLPSAA